MLEIGLIAVVAFLVGAAAAGMFLRKGREVMRATIESLQVRLAETQAYLRAEKEKNAWTEDAKERFKDAFKVLASSRSEEHTSELQSLRHLVFPLLLEKKKKQKET